MADADDWVTGTAPAQPTQDSGADDWVTGTQASRGQELLRGVGNTFRGVTAGAMQSWRELGSDFTSPIDTQTYIPHSEGVRGELEAPFAPSIGVLEGLGLRGAKIAGDVGGLFSGAIEGAISPVTTPVIQKGFEATGMEPEEARERAEAATSGISNIPLFVDGAVRAPHLPEVNPKNFAEQPKSIYTSPVPASPILTGEMGDASVAHSNIGPVLDAFGEGPRTNWGVKDLVSGLDTKTIPSATLKDMAQAHAEAVKAFNEAFQRSAASSALVQAGPTITEQLAAARSLAVIGEGEAGWKGTIAPDEASAAARVEAGKLISTDAPEFQPPTVHEMARQVAPEVFGGEHGYDALLDRQNELRTWLGEARDRRDQGFAAAPPMAEDINAIQDKIDGILGKVSGVEEKLTKTKAGQLSDLRDQMDDLRDQSAELARQDTEEMQRVRQAIQQNDYKMRDLAPQVSAAYREAAARLPEPPVRAEPIAEQPKAEVAPEPAAPEPVAQEIVGKAIAEQSAPKPVAEPIGRPVPQNVAADVSQKLQAAGRPAEEADAAGQLIQAHYDARAARFNGALGTGPELYAREAPEVRAGRVRQAAAGEKVREYAQTAYHGSPHKFDEFTLDHIGKGEGAQAFGHGLYFAGSKAVAKFYRETLASETFETAQGKAFDPNSLEHLNVRNAVRRNGADLDASIERARSLLSGASEQTKPMLERDIAKLEELKRGGGIQKNQGRLYHVELAPQEHEYLDWDKPLDEQTPHVQSALAKFAPDFFDPKSDDYDAKEPGQMIYHRLSSMLADQTGRNEPEGWIRSEPTERTNPKAASEALLKEGVRGIKYQDQGSRGAEGGSHNYVIFNDADVAIKSYEQSARGKIAFKNGQSLITLMKDANASTFIHETGHQWLEELMRDGAHDLAPADLKADAKTVRDYLGVKEGEDITTGQHEKFARSFERYMMEGVAPSKGLADVFAKFKNWLTQIYQTVAKLRAPINDDIRAVFDRLVDQPEEKPVIAPEGEPEKSLADIHEADALHTAPEHADHVGDVVADEVNRVADRRTPDLAPTLANDRQAQGVEPEAPGGAAGTERTEPGPGEASDAKANAEVPPGGGNVAAEGAPARATPAAPSNKSEPPAGPNARFTEPGTELIDRAGNIRLDKLETPDDVKEVIRETAHANDDFFSARRGRISDAQALDLADALGMDASTLNLRKIGQAFNAEQILAARKLLVQSATSVREAMIKAASGSDADVLAYGEAAARHRMIQEQVSGITAEAGRALRAFRQIVGQDTAEAVGKIIGTNDEKTLFQLRQEAKLGSSLETPQQVSKFVNDVEATRWQKTRAGILEYYINALISGPITHMRYSVGNAVNALWTPLVEIPTAAAIGRLTGAEERVHLGEAGAQLYAIAKGSREGWKAAVEAFKSGASPALPGEALNADFMGPRPHAIPGRIGDILNLPSHSVAAIHSFFKSLRYEQNVQGLAYRTAANEGLAGTAFDSRIAELMRNPPEAMMEAATQDALKELYMAPTEYSSFMGNLNRAINSSLPAKIIVPFMKIGSQITRNAFIERTPLGVFSREVRENLLGTNGETAQQIQAAKMAGGVSLIGITTMLAAEGLATGDGPVDPKERATWLLTHQPNHITIGSISIPYQGLGHLGMLMRFSANAYETAHAWDGKDFEKLVPAALEGVSKSVLDDNFMRGVKDMLDAVYHYDEYGQQYLRGFATNWIPFSVGLGQVTREIDPFHRVAKTTFDEARAKIPLVSEDLQPRYDMFGQPISNSGPNPAYQNDPVVKLFESLHFGLGRLRPEIRGVKLTDQQFADYSRISGRLIHDRLSALAVPLAAGPGAPAEKIAIINRLVESSREEVRSQIMKQSKGTANDIVAQASARKAQGLH